MQNILLIVNDPARVKYATSLAREMTEKLYGQDIKVTLFADGAAASRMLIFEEGKIRQVTAAGGEVISCVSDIQDVQTLSKITGVMQACLIAIEEREREGAEVMHV